MFEVAWEEAASPSTQYEVLEYGKVSVARGGELLRDVGAQETGGARNRHPYGKSGFS